MQNCILITSVMSTMLILQASDVQTEGGKKNEVIKEIVRKICNITMGPMHNQSHEKKTATIKELELKLKRVAEHLRVDKSNNVDVILQGIKMMTLNNDYELCLNGVRTRSDKQSLLDKMVHKLEILAKKLFKNNILPSDENKKVLAKIKNRVEKAFYLRNLTTDSQNNSYTDLIMEGLEMIMFKDNNLRRMSLGQLRNNFTNLNEDVYVGGSIDYQSIKDDNSRRMPLEQLRNNFTNSNDVYVGGMLSNLKTTWKPTQGLTTLPDCDHNNKNICKALKNLNEFICHGDGITLNLEKICDGDIDCPDGSDELDCAKHAVARAHIASGIMMDVDKSRMCYSSDLDNSLIAQQGEMLNGIIVTDVHFLNMYVNDNNAKGFNHSVTEISNNVALFLRSFVIALDGGFCSNPQPEFGKMLNRNNELLDKNVDEDMEPKFSVKLCSCKGRLCADANCMSSCKRICHKKYLLQRLSCNAINGDSSVPLDLICDGKIDCYDEADESSCMNFNNLAKYKAISMFDDILKAIKMKSLINDLPARNKLIKLYNAVQDIQRLSIKTNVKPTVYRSIRDRCFTLLVNIYDEMLDTIRVINEEEEVYDFLESINQKLIIALKHSKTGNHMIASPDVCFCREFSCSSSRCSKRCTRVCAAKPKLTRFACNNSGINVTYVPIDLVCNGKQNCPRGEDEFECKKEVCRAHHLMLLKSRLQNLDQNYGGSVLEEVLKVWKKKVIAMLEPEKLERPTAHNIKKIVGSILSDVVKAYGGLEVNQKANSDHTQKTFEKVAQRILKIVKSCGV